ncbi:MAG: hypothetical protein MSA33_08815 [Campylobacter sp.]|uniref:hypothetical protein n=1 Tax=Campylobacter sp. TaxID=205 RepID=UPI002AA6073F|nr:hypothetical protein [Campylobacter sp.]MCI7550522.1 hypothetical protein [Campylobacter sp.]
MLSDQTAFISIIALVAIWLVCKFCENLALRVWLFIAIIWGLIFVLGADGDFWQFIFLLVIFLLGIVLLGYAVMPIVVLLVWAVVLAILRYGFKQSITPSLAFSAFSFVAWYAFNLVTNIIALILCSIGYLINLKKSKDFKPYLLRYAPVTGAVLYILSLLGQMP